jgi:hypothetical protein
MQSFVFSKFWLSNVIVLRLNKLQWTFFLLKFGRPPSTCRLRWRREREAVHNLCKTSVWNGYFFKHLEKNLFNVIIGSGTETDTYIYTVYIYSICTYIVYIYEQICNSCIRTLKLQFVSNIPTSTCWINEMHINRCFVRSYQSSNLGHKAN